MPRSCRPASPSPSPYPDRAACAAPAAARRAGGLVAALVAVLLGAGLLAGCGPDAPPPPFARATLAFAETPEGRADALALLDTIQTTAMDSAFARLARQAYTRHVRTQQTGPGAVRAARTQVVRYDATGGATVVRIDSAGTFPDGGLLAPTPDPTARLTAFPADALPDDPPYRTPRTQEAYRYRVRPDTLAGGLPVRVLEIQRRADAVQQPVIQRARLFVEADGRQLVALDLVRVSSAVLFGEASRVYVQLQRAPDAGDGPAAAWRPLLARTWAHVDARLRQPLLLETTSAFYDFE